MLRTDESQLLVAETRPLVYAWVLAPTVSVMVSPEPGRPISLGREQDLADAGDLLAVLRAVLSQNSVQTTRRADRVAREALWWMWEQRRLPAPLIRSKYPTKYPWSAAARERVSRLSKDGLRSGRLRGVIIEHLIPWGITIRNVVDRADSLAGESLVDILTAHGAAAVITVEEDQQLSKEGLANRMPSDWDGLDLWARAKQAKLHLAGFAPLDPPASANDTPG
jgi:hypothetical protein